MVDAISAEYAMKTLTTFFDIHTLFRRVVRNGPNGRCLSMTYILALICFGPLTEDYSNGLQTVQSAERRKYHNRMTL